MYKEIVEHSLQNRNVIIPVGNIDPAPCNYERYASLFSFDANVMEYIRVNGGSIALYPGDLYADAFPLDIDCGDLELARQNAVKAVAYLNTEFSLSPDDITYYFSGNKGFHLMIDAKCFGGFTGSPDLYWQMKELAYEIAEHVDNLDMKIYDAVRIFRVPNSKNDKSGLYKVELSFDELQNLTIYEIKELALNPRTDFLRPKPIYNITRNNLLSIHWANIINKPKPTDVHRGELFSDGDFFCPPQEGERNSQFFRQSAMLFDLTNGQLHKNSVLQIIRSINQCSPNPLDDEELKQIVKNAERRIERSGKIKPIQEKAWKTVAELVPGYEAMVLDKRSKLYFGIPSIDKEFKGKLRGKVGGIIGLGGTKKSLLAQQILNHNISEHGAIGMVNTAEMSWYQWLEREIDQIVDIPGYNASDVIKDYYEKDIETARVAMHKDIAKRLGNSLFISQNSRLSTDDYRNAIIENSNKAGKIDILLVDGLSLMAEGNKGEVEASNKNTADLKELANEFDLFILLIIHVVKTADKTKRDLYGDIRGSQKIADNLDFMVYLSMCEDIDRSTSYNTEYLSDRSYIRLFNKRGSGNTINIIAAFDKHRLLMTETNEDPLWHERK